MIEGADVTIEVVQLRFDPQGLEPLVIASRGEERAADLVRYIDRDPASPTLAAVPSK